MATAVLYRLVMGPRRRARFRPRGVAASSHQCSPVRPNWVRRYERATATHKAVIHVAVDARRVGIQSPLTFDLLRSAARDYLCCAA
jgi:hypothetical protein